MWSFTLRTTGRSAEQSFLDIRIYWGKLHDRLTRLCGHFEYILMVETTEAGYAHLHVLVSRFFRHELMSRLWLAVTGDSFIVHFSDRPGVAAAQYLAKYVGKEARQRAGRGGMLAGQHLFSKSKGVVFDAFMTKGKGWSMVPMSYRQMVERARRYCCVLSDVGWPHPRLELEAVNGYESLRSWRPHSPDSPLWRGNGRWG